MSLKKSHASVNSNSQTSEQATPLASPQPLAGLTVLEFSHTVMGPCAGLLFADLGATVIKVEPAPDGDRTRALRGFASGFFAMFNRNKQSLAINLKSSEGQSLMYQLVQSADVVLDNYGPGTMEKLGCGALQLMELNPRLIYLCLKGFLHGPWEHRPALDEVVQFQSGLAYMTGPPGQPLRAGASIVDILGAVFGVTGVLAALRERETTDRGQRVGSSLFESAVFLMGTHMAGSACTGETVPPMTARRGAWGVYDVFQGNDGEPVFIGVTSDAQWKRFCDEFGFSDLLSDERLGTNPERTTERACLIPELRNRLGNFSYRQLVGKSIAADISWAPVGRPEDLFENEQLLAGGGLVETMLSTALNSAERSALLPLLPLEFGGERQRLGLHQQPPELGQHTTEILVNAGYTADAIDRWQQQGVVHCYR